MLQRRRLTYSDKFASIFRAQNAAAPPGGPVHLEQLVFELPDDLSSLSAPWDRLRRFGKAGQADREILTGFLEGICPSGAPGTLIVSNAALESGRPAYERSLSFRPIHEGPRVETFARNGFTLGLRVFRRQGRLVLSAIEETPHLPPRDFEVIVSGLIHWGLPRGQIYMSPQDFDRLGDLPDRRSSTNLRLAPWRNYLGWREELIRTNQISIAYIAWRRIEQTSLAFLVKAQPSTRQRLTGVEVSFTPTPEEPSDTAESGVDTDDESTRDRRRAPRPSELGEIEALGEFDKSRANTSPEWSPKQIRPAAGDYELIVRIPESRRSKVAGLEIPSRGIIVSNLAGDLAPIKNQRDGIDRVRNSQGFSPKLAEFLFDARNASVPPLLPAELPPIEGGRKLNPGQTEAVIKALAAPDLCLIQGPPGTGKTTVIAEICLRATTAGQRVLVASQTNLAVDNALARLADRPAIRRLRLGNAERVDEEFKEFLAEHVISRWFSDVAADSQRRMHEARSRAEQLRSRRAHAEQLRATASRYTTAMASRQRLSEQRDRAAELRRLAEDKLRTADATLSSRQESHALWSSLEAWAREDGHLPPRLEALADGFDPAQLRHLDESSNRLHILVRLIDALELVRRVTSDGPVSPELRDLRAQRSQLLDATDDADLKRLGDINRRLKLLESDDWTQATRDLDRAVRAAHGDALPDDVHRVIDALKPSPEVEQAAVRALAAARHEKALALENAEARRELAPQFATKKLAASLAQTSAQTAFEVARSELDASVTALTDAEQSCIASDRHLAELASSWDLVRSDPTLADHDIPTSPSIDAAEALIAELALLEESNAPDQQRSASWSKVQEEWISRLARASESDREQLEGLYIRHANVVGMTTNEAGKRQTWQNENFRPFDIVIIDEVSKCTPPELILPMLLGRKTVLVGDHRQLPPMFRERDASFGEAGAEEQIPPTDLAKYQRMVTASLFQELFEQAHDHLKATLWMQYRMHPQIMHVVNEFYEQRLLPGPDERTLATRRPHHLRITDSRGGDLLTPDNHLLWLDSSTDTHGARHFEEQVGTSKRNRLEVDLVVQMVLRLGRALRERGFSGVQTLTIARRDDKRPLGDLLAETLPQLPSATLHELFDEGNVRLAGRVAKPSTLAVAGLEVEVRAEREVGVITFYGAQLKALREALDRARHDEPEAFLGMSLRTNTVDRFQGMEKPIIITSLVRSTENAASLGAFVREFQRINVGLSRAQQLLVIVGARETWRHVQVPLLPIAGGPATERPVYANILDHVRQAGGLRGVGQLLDR